MFEQEAIVYLNGLVQNSIFLDGYIIGISESAMVARALVTILKDGEAKESYILIKKQNDIFTWMYLEKTDTIENEFDPSVDGWHYQRYQKRIITSESFLEKNPKLELYFRINNYPYTNIDGYIYMYFKEITIELLNICLSETIEYRYENIISLTLPNYNPLTEKLTNDYFDETNVIYTRNVDQMSQLEISQKGWHYIYPKRLIAPKALLDVYPTIALQMMIRNLPIIEDQNNNTFILYMNYVSPEHQAIVDANQGVITIEDYPQ